ncbi:MAG: hypothetical protein CNE95_00575 [Puniceicoccaceae bacterium MED-G30]|nr:MAG: hypothetical protein CNE95_00575 [Puniceicoccaceae bacterium MED-G30]
MLMNALCAIRLSLLSLCFLPMVVHASLRLGAPFSDGMVLQRSSQAVIWGWATAGETVRVDASWGSRARSRAGADGYWILEIETPGAGGPHTISVEADEKILLQDVLIGEVWLASGQSNMEYALSKDKDAEAALNGANLPEIRLLHVGRRALPAPLDTLTVQWQVCSPDTVANFSAVAYYFAKKIHEELDVPVGIIDTCWGGTRVSPWTAPEAFAGSEEAFIENNRKVESNYARDLKKYESTGKGRRPTLHRGWSYLYNGMIHPLVPYTLQGFLWYQGETNRSDGVAYGPKFKRMIESWRTAWGGDLPFYFVQIAPYAYSQFPHRNINSPLILPELREGQQQALELPNTGMAVITDLGNLQDIHPAEKAPVGDRLALLALRHTYDQPCMADSPSFARLSIEGDRARIFWRDADGLQSSDEANLSWFQIAGANRVFYPAEALIEGDTVLLHSPEVAQPVAVRFAWHESAEPNLVNSAGLPAVPFRSDDWINAAMADQPIIGAKRFHNPQDKDGYLILEDFEGTQQTGSSPVGVTRLRPSRGSGEANVKVVAGADNLADNGSGSGLQLQDFSTTEGVALEYEWNESVSVLEVSFDFVCHAKDGSGLITLGVGTKGVPLISNNVRLARCSLYGNGKVFRQNTSDGRPHQLLCVVNDLDGSAFPYVDPQGNSVSIPPNSAAYWLDGRLLHREPLRESDPGNSRIYETGKNLGRIGLNSTTMHSGLHFIIDNIAVWDLLPEAKEAHPEATAGSVPGSAPNVLLIMVDDLRPELGCYGAEYMQTPGIDRLAGNGVLFSQAYCQQAICGPSRISMFTGLRPDSTGIYALSQTLEETLPDTLTMVEHFKTHGYETVSLGKIYHDKNEDKAFWDVLDRCKADYYVAPESLAKIEERKAIALANGLTPDAGNSSTAVASLYKRAIRGPAYESAAVPDNTYTAGIIAERATGFLKNRSAKPFFLAVGFRKPHLPFVAPKKYWDLYDESAIVIPSKEEPEGAPSVAFTNWGELRSYHGIPEEGYLDAATARTLIHGYRACVSYVDRQISKLLDELASQGLEQETLILLVGDHGFKLGEYGDWSKHTNFELDTRVPMIVSGPGVAKGEKSDALVELADVFSSLSEYCGLPATQSDGFSMVPVWKKPSRPWKLGAFSQYPRKGGMGYSVKSAGWRYTEWFDQSGAFYDRELYDHRDSHLASVNLAEDPEFLDQRMAMEEILLGGPLQALPQE